MCFDARTLCELRKGARLYDATKERVKERISRNINVAVEKLKAVEKALLDDADIEFGENPFSELLGSIESGSKHCTNEEVKTILEMSAPSDFGPDEDSFCALFKEIESFKDWRRKNISTRNEKTKAKGGENEVDKQILVALVPRNIRCVNIRSDSMSLFWDDVKCECFYEIELKSLNAIERTYHSLKPECTLHDLEPSTKYHIRVRTVPLGGSGQSIWSNPIVVQTKSVFSKCVWKRCPYFSFSKSMYSLDEGNPIIATKSSGDESYQCTIIGSAPIPLNQVASWNIKILKSKDNDGRGICIGVAPSDINQNIRNNYKKCGWYFVCYFSTLWSGPPQYCSRKEYGPRKSKDGRYVHTGDSVGVVMDTAKGELSFVLNGVNLGIAFEGIPLDKPLVPCVLLGIEGDSVELSSFKQSPK